MAWMTGSTMVLVLTATAAAASPPHTSQHRIPEGRATIRGPALDRPLELGGQPYFDLIYLAGLVPDWSPPPPGQRTSEPSFDEIGALHQVSYSFRVAGRKPVSLEQTLYLRPGGLGEAWVETKPEQVIPLVGGGRLMVPSGWWRSEVLGDFLRGVMLAGGLTGSASVATGPVSPSRPAPTAAVTELPRGTAREAKSSRMLIGIAALGLLLLIGAVEARPGPLQASRRAPS